MSTAEQPAYGTERYTLMHPRKNVNEPYEIHRLVFVEPGTTVLYDEDAKDFVTWKGSWQLVEVLGRFESREAAGEFMRSRGRAA